MFPARAAAPAALWPSAFGDSGRSLQGRVAGPRTSAADAVGYSHLLHVAWRWSLPSSGSSSFYYGAIDAAGAVYFLETGNGAAPHVVHKADGATGATLWTSKPPPVPRYGNFDGNDHLVVDGSESVFVIAGTTVTLADCGWLQALDSADGAQRWWVNGTSAVANAVLSTDGATLYASFANASVSAIDAATGAVRAHWDLSALLPAAPSVAHAMTLVASAAVGADVLIFACLGNFSALSTKAGDVLWHIDDPVAGEFASRAAAPAAGAYAGVFFTSAGGNYMQGAGAAAIDVATGAVVWSRPTTTVIGSTAVPTAQGFEWQLQSLGSGSSMTLNVVSMADGTPLAPAAYFPSYGFSSAPVAAADGACVYIFGSGTINDLSACSLRSFCFDGSAITAEFSAALTGVRAPSRYKLAPGPAPGRLTLWHDAGVIALEAMRLAPPPPPPPPTPRSGEMFGLVFGKSEAACLSGGGDVSVTPAVLLRAKAAPAPPVWKLGARVAALALTGSCGTAAAAPAIDAAGRRAWVLFGCTPPGGPTATYVAELALGAARGTPPTLTSFCTWPASARSGALFFDARVATDAPYFLDARAQFTRAFYTVGVPPLPPGLGGGAAAAQCVRTQIGELQGVAVVPSSSLLAADASDAARGPRLFAASVTDFGIRLIGMTVPGGAPAGDMQLPCDTGLCFDNIRLLAVRNGTVLAGGSASSPPDWPVSTLVQAQRLGAGARTYTGLVSTAAPLFPLVLPAAGAAAVLLADPAAAAGAAWLQTFSTGPTVCTAAADPGLLQSVAIVDDATKPSDSVLVLNATEPACPLPVGQLCYSIVAGHVQAFTEA